ncbi:TetR/AcrR family transcriptional regulator [Mariniluteicoccus flavus]
MTTMAEPPITARREKTRQRLMSAAESVIAEKGFAAASVEEICERADFTRGAFYSNFATKEDLAFALMRAHADAQMAAAEAAIAQATTTPADDDSLEDLIDRAVNTFVASQPDGRDQILLQAELRLHAVRHAEFREAYAGFSCEMTDLFAATIDGTLRTRGFALAIPADRAVTLLHGVQEFASMDALLGGATDMGDKLKTVLRTLVRPA